MCDDKRQEFILLSDTLGVSMLVDAINHRRRSSATETTVLGPFFVKDAPEHARGADISGGMPGDPMLVTGAVNDVERQAGRRRHRRCLAFRRRRLLRRAAPGRDALAMRARFRTDEDGKFWFWSIKPPPTRCRMTGRSARCWRRRAVIPGGPRTCTS